MKRKLLSGLILLLLAIGLLQLPARAQAEKDILEKMIKALGGREALAEIKDTRMTGNIEILQYGMNAPVTIYQKEPDKYRMELEVMGMSMITVYDGQKAMMTNPQTGEVLELPADQAKSFRRQALGNDATLHPEKYGITYTFKGEETIDGKKYLVLEQKFQDGDLATIYLDATTYLPYKSKSKALGPTGTEIESESIMSDYRKVGKTMVPFSISILQSGVEQMKITITEVVYNTGLEDSLFVLK